jgi:hypothetical protein
VAQAADEPQLAQHPARRRVGAITAEIQLAAALRTRRRARLELRDRRRGDVDGGIRRRAWQLSRQAFDLANVLSEGALALASFAPGTGWAANAATVLCRRKML